MGNEVLLAVGDTTGLQTWLTKSIVPVILTVVALTMMILSRKKKNREIIEISLGVIIALVWLGVAAAPGKAVEVGSWAAGMLFG